MKESEAIEQHCHILNVEGIANELREYRVAPHFARILLQHDIDKEVEAINEKNGFINIVAFQVGLALVILQFINYILDAYQVEQIWRGIVCIIAFVLYPVQIILSLLTHYSRFQGTWKRTLLNTLASLS